MIDFKTIRTGDKVKVVGDSSWKDAVGIVICKNDVNESFLVSLDKDNLRISFFENELAKVGDSMRSIEELLNKLPDSVRKSLYKDAVDLKPIKQQILDSFAELRTNLDAACDLNKSLEQALKQSEENCRKQVEDLKSEYKKCHTFHQIQSLAVSWSYKNFGEHYGTGYRNLLGIAEEVGELCHAQLKGEQGIRHTPEEISQLKKDAVGDIIIFLCNYCDSQNLSLHECVNIAWNEIKDRNWQYDNLTREERK